MSQLPPALEWWEGWAHRQHLGACPSGNTFPPLSRTASHREACLLSLGVATEPPASRERRYCFPPGPPTAGWVAERVSRPGALPGGALSCLLLRAGRRGPGVGEGGAWGRGCPGHHCSWLGNCTVGVAHTKSTTPWALQTQTQGCRVLEAVITVGKTALLKAPQPLGDEMFTKGNK